MSNKPYRKIEADDDFSMIFIEIGDYTLIANLAPHLGVFTASVWYGNEKRARCSFDEDNPALAISRCKKWITDNPIIESDEVQA